MRASHLAAIAVGKQLADALRCTQCGKLTSSYNVAGHRQQYREAPIPSDDRCTCPKAGAA